MSAFLTIVAIHFVVLISPGPDFLLVSRNSLVSSSKTGILTAIGITLGMLVHMTYSLLGIGFVIAKSILLFNTIKYAGALYLLYIGWKALWSKETAHATHREPRPRRMITQIEALQMGFICNVLNPKATLFFLALFTQVISPGTPVFIQMLYCIAMMTTTFLWFSSVASVLSLDIIRKPFARMQAAAERVMGGLLMALG